MPLVAGMLLLVVGAHAHAGDAADRATPPSAGARPVASVAPASAGPSPRPAMRDTCPLGTIQPGTPEPPSDDEPVHAPKKKAWEDARGGQAAARPFIRARLAGWPTTLLVDRATLPHDDRAFLERLARDTWRGLAAFTDRENGLPVDHVDLGTGPLDGPGAQVGDYTNVTNIGLALVAIVAAHELAIIDAADAVARVTRILDTLDRLERHDGFFFNYYDTTSLERTSAFLSFVDLSWLTTGLVVVRAAFPALAPRATALVDQMDFGFFWDPALGQVSHGYYVHKHARSRYHYGMLYTEARLGVAMAIGKGDVPADAWFGMVRTYPPDCRGQSLVPIDMRRADVLGHVFETGLYDFDGRKFVPSWGGSMFEALMPALVLDERAHAPESLGRNDVVHAEIQRRYALETLGYPVWGMSSSAKPGGGYGEYGVRFLGARGYPAGVVTPHASALALMVTPEPAARNLRTLAERFDLYGEYGLYDAVDPTSGAVARTYMALDQSMLFVALANHLKPGCVQRLFGADPIMKAALPVLGAEHFFD